jgi:hypothetical protein
LRRDRAAFPTVEVRNVAANGDVWSGHGDEVTRIFPPLASLTAGDRPSENMCSIGLRLRYGRFSLFTGGDMPGVPDAGAPSWQSVETAVARAISHRCSRRQSPRFDRSRAVFPATLARP